MARGTVYRAGRTYIGRLTPGEDIIQALSAFCRLEGVTAGWITLIGTVQRATLGYFDEHRREYLRIPVERFMEVISCQGNVSLKDGEPFVHLHIVLSGPDGQTVAGHLFEGTVFVAEFCLQEVSGAELVRKPDPQSGLALWDM